MLIGEFQHNMDKKGRVFIPAKLRADLGERFVVSKALDKTPCLFIYSASEWQKLTDKINEQPFVKARKLQRYLFSGASELDSDAQGRICIPQTLRDYAGLTDSVPLTIVGSSNRIEVWNSENWAAETDEITEDEIVSILEELNF